MVYYSFDTISEQTLIHIYWEISPGVINTRLWVYITMGMVYFNYETFTDDSILTVGTDFTTMFGTAYPGLNVLVLSFKDDDFNPGMM